MQPIVISDSDDGEVAGLVDDPNAFQVQLFSGETRTFRLGDQSYALDLAAIDAYLSEVYPPEEIGAERPTYRIFFIPKNQRAGSRTLEGTAGAPTALLGLLERLRQWFNAEATERAAAKAIDLKRKKERDAFLIRRILIVAALSDEALRYEPGRQRGEAVSIRAYGQLGDAKRLSRYSALLEQLALEQELRPYLTNPLKADSSAEDPWRITLLAFADEEQRLELKAPIVGFCSCLLVRYRSERAAILVEQMAEYKERRRREMQARWTDWLRDTKIKLSPLEAARPPQLPVFAYEVSLDNDAVGGALRNLFVIDALSVLPTQSGRNIALTLLHAALGFLQQRRIRRLYPVSHVTCHAASYVTKRLLVSTYQARYYGTNQFINEHFVSTLDNAQKQAIVDNINALLQHCLAAIDIYLVSAPAEERANGAAVARLLEPQGVRALLTRFVVRLYQLYLLVIQTVVEQQRQPAAALNFFNGQTMGHFRVLFRLLGEPPENFEQGTLNQRMWLQGRGFVVKPLDDRRTKPIYREGYDVLYDAVRQLIDLVLLTPGLAALGEAQLQALDAITGQVIARVNTALEQDLGHVRNYALPIEQCERLVSLVDEVEYTAPEHQVQAQRQLALRLALKRRVLAMKEHEAFYDWVWKRAMDRVTGEEDALHDTYMATEALFENRARDEAAYRERIDRALAGQPAKQPPTEEMDLEEQAPDSQPEQSSQLDDTLNEALNRADEEQTRQRANPYVFDRAEWLRRAHLPQIRTAINDILM